MKQKTQNPLLYLIPVTLGDTPLEAVLPEGNLSIIRSLEYFIVEDLRSARRFLRKAGYAADLDEHRFQLLNEHTDEIEMASLVGWIKSVTRCGLLSESGLPCIADPGAGLVGLARKEGISIKALSGPSSIFLALMASGFDGQKFTFHGYLPIEKKARADAIRELERSAKQGKGTQIFIEAPYRNDQMLADIIKVCQPATLLCVAAELTTVSEWVFSGPVSSWKQSVPSLNKRNTVFLISA